MKRSGEIFEMVVELDVDARTVFLDRECGRNSALRAEVESLLAAHGAAGAFLAEPTHAVERADRRPGAEDDTAACEAAPVPASRVIGRYKLLEQIGEGGFGTVWAAEQREPVKRRVALKIIKLGMDTKQVIARFEAERQALAMMDHPNIARVLDAGATETGRPYFVMELVKGVSILDYCDTEKLDTRARLGLFMKVCHAIQHAHQKGIIHRDIKPSNVLVTLHDGAPVPRVIDFGIAKATNAELTEKTLYTQHHQMVGTPAYMSPEQAEMSGLDIDTRSDVYALGVLLYELLTGTTPFDAASLRQAGFAEMMRIIREEEPHKPSTRLSSLGDTGSRTAERRRVDLKKLGLLLSGDLDWIVMKCLEKDRTRRYETASGLAEEIRRHLDDEPVAAGAPSAGYKLRKFVKRNRGAVVAASVVVLVVLLGVAGTSGGLWWALGERHRANIEREIAEAVNEFLNDDLLASVAPSSKPGEGRDVKMREVLDEAAGRIEEASRVGGRFADKPLVEAAIRLTLGETYRQLGLDAAAMPHLERARDLSLDHLGDEHPDTLRATNSLAVLYEDQGRYRDAIPLHRETLAIRRRLGEYGDEHPDTLTSMHNLASVYWQQRRLSLAEPLYRETLETRQRTLGREHPDTLSSMNELAALYWRQALGTWNTLRNGDSDALSRKDLEALFAKQKNDCDARCNECMKICMDFLGEEDPITLESIHLLAAAHALAERYDDAARLFEQALDARERVLDEEHPDTLRSMEQLVMVYGSQKRWSERKPLSAELRSRRRSRAYQENASPMDKNQYAWALVLPREPVPEEAEEGLRLSLESNDMTGYRNATCLDTLARAYHKTGDNVKAIETQKSAMALLSEDETDFHAHMEHWLAKFEAALVD